MQVLKQQNGRYYEIESIKLTSKDAIGFDGKEVVLENSGNYKRYEIETSMYMKDARNVVQHLEVVGYSGATEEEAEWDEELCGVYEVGEVIEFAGNEWIAWVGASKVTLREVTI